MARNQKIFGKAIKYLSKQQSTIPILNYQDTTAKCNFEKATLLNEFFQHVLTDIFLLSHLRIVTITPCNITYVQISYFVQLVFSFKSSYWICLGLMESQHKCLRYILYSALPHLLPNFSMFPFAKVTSLIVGRHLLLSQFPNMQVSVTSLTIGQYLYF